MPEAFAVLFVFVVAIAAWIGAWTQARNPSHDTVQEEIVRLQQHAAWLQQRLVLARRENWDEAMVSTIANELRATAHQLARVNSKMA
jgi:hypothetical protein